MCPKSSYGYLISGRDLSAHGDLELLLMKTWLGADGDALLEPLFQFFQPLAFLVIEEICHLGMNRQHQFGAADIQHLPPQFPEQLVADGQL